MRGLGAMCAMTVWRLEDKLKQSALSSHHVYPRLKLKLLGLASRVFSSWLCCTVYMTSLWFQLFQNKNLKRDG